MNPQTPNSRKPSKGVASIAAVTAGAAFGVGATMSQVIAGYGVPISYVTVAQFLAGVVMLGLLVAVKFHEFPPAKDIAKLLGIGLLQPLSAITYYYAISYLSVGQAVAIQFQYVWIAVVIQCIVEKSKPSSRMVVSTVCIILGTLLAAGIVDDVLGSGGGAPFNLIGAGLAVACAVSYAVFIYLNGKVATETHPVTRSFVMVISGACLVSVLFGDFYVNAISFGAPLLAGGASLGLLSGMLPVLCLSMAGRALPGGLVAIFTSAELPAAVLSGCLILGDTTSILMVVGVAVVIASIAVPELLDMRGPKHQLPPIT